MRLLITSQYGILSRGRHSARQTVGSSVIWATKDENGNLVIDSPGTWNLHCSDGFNRSARATLHVATDGSFRLSGDAKRFTVI